LRPENPVTAGKKEKGVANVINKLLTFDTQLTTGFSASKRLPAGSDASSEFWNTLVPIVVSSVLKCIAYLRTPVQPLHITQSWAALKEAEVPNGRERKHFLTNTYVCTAMGVHSSPNFEAQAAVVKSLTSKYHQGMFELAASIADTQEEKSREKIHNRRRAEAS
jgi:hypothetical protein